MKKIFLFSALCFMVGTAAMAQTDTSFNVRAKDTVITKQVKVKFLQLLGGDGVYLRDSTWKIGGFIGASVAQTALYQWAPGGTNSFSMLFNINAYANYKKGKVSWCSNLDMKYGMVAVGMLRNGLAKRNFQKNIDVLQLSTNVGYDITDHLYFSGKASFLSQFSPTYDYSQTDTANGNYKKYVVSKFAGPLIVTLGPGFTWKPKDYFAMFFTPIEGKITVVAGAFKDTAKSDPNSLYYTGIDPTRFGLQAGSHYMAQLGAEIDIMFQKDIVKNVNWKSHLNIFESYLNSSYNQDMPYLLPNDSLGIKVISAKTQYIPTFTWDNDIVFKINKVLSATLSTRFIYQYNAQVPIDVKNNSNGNNKPDGITDVDKNGNTVLGYGKLQIFEQFGLGLAFKF